MNYENIILDVLASKEFNSVLTEKLADKITQDYYKNDMSEGLLIKEQVRELVKKEAEIIIKDLINDYYELTPIKEMIEKELKKLTKAEIIKIFSNP